MFRFAVFVGEELEISSLAERLEASSLNWLAVYAGPRVRVLCRGIRARSNEVYALAGGAGIILGKLFETGRTGEPHRHAPLAIEANESRAICASAGRRLISHYWGRYVAVLCPDCLHGATCIVRSPGVALPCLRLRVGNAFVYVSSMEDGAQVLNHPPTVNWDYVAAWLSARVNGHATMLREVEQLLAGECEVIHDGLATRELYWNPLEIARKQSVRDVTAAIAHLREAVRAAVRAWASCYDRILLALSGGLDSSIVAACLRDAPMRPSVTCFNHYVPGPASDEREFAQAAADAAGLPLLILPRDPQTDLRPIARVQRVAKLWNLIHSAELGGTEFELASSTRADAIMTGEGGDQVFFQARGALAAGDYLRRRGMRPGFFKVAFDGARMDGESLWRVLGQALRAQLPGQAWSPERDAGGTRTLLSSDALESVRRGRLTGHPWLTSSVGAPSGARWHAAMLLAERPYYDPLWPDANLPDPIAPLLSQPVIEAALCPTYLHIDTGWDRSVARRAFERELPEAIVARRAKGDFEDHARSMRLHNLDFMREILFGGALVRHQIIDRTRLSAALSRGPSASESENLELYDCLSAEVLVRPWIA